MSKRIRLGVIGAGRIGQIHATNIANHIPTAELVAVADVVKNSAELCAAQCGAKEVYDDPRRILEHSTLDAVVICSATDAHAQQIEFAAATGKHIFCEKPIDQKIEKIDGALAAVKKAGVLFQVGFNRRFDPSFRRAQSLVAEGKIGVPHLVRITSRDPQPPPAEYVKVSGGMFLDMTIHDFDMARWIIQTNVEEIFAMSAVLVNPEIGKLGDIDTAMISLKYASGALGSIDNSRRAAYGYDQRVEVFGSEGNVVVANVAPTTAVLSRSEGVTTDKPLHFFLERYQAAYVAEMQEFVDCIISNRTPSVTGQDGRIPVLMAMAAQASRQQNKPVRVEANK